MSARDELRGTLCNTICNVSLYTKRAQPYLLGSDMRDVLDKTADRILAAGYVKRRTINTIEELDALGRMSTVLANNGCVWINDGDAADQWCSLAEFDPIWRCSADVDLPAIVLHERGAA